MKKYSRATWMFLVPAMIMMAVVVIGALKGPLEPVHITFLCTGMVFLSLAIMTESKAQKPPSGTD